MDLRIVKTHKVIREAFINLLSDKDYDAITIQDILDTALVNRATFYKYYSGKSDLTGQLIEQFKAEMKKILEARLTTDSQAMQHILEQNAQYIFGLRKQMLALFKVRTHRHNLYQEMFEMKKQNFIDLAQQQKVHEMTNLSNLDYQATMMATLFMASLQYYFEQDLPIPKDLPNEWQQMIDIVKI